MHTKGEGKLDPAMRVRLGLFKQKFTRLRSRVH